MVLKIDATECIDQRLQGVIPCRRFQLALPYSDTVPPHCGKLALLLFVANAVALYLGPPERRVGLWHHEVPTTFVPMPEAAVDEDDSPVFAQDNVRMPRQTWVVQPVAEPSAEQELSHQFLWRGISPSYRSHTTMALLFGQFVHRGQLGLIFLLCQFDSADYVISINYYSTFSTAS